MGVIEANKSCIGACCWLAGSGRGCVKLSDASRGDDGARAEGEVQEAKGRGV